MIYVLSSSGKPLMPTEKYGKVRHMLKDGRAKVVKRTPFTIQLTYDSDEFVQPVSLGVMPGYEEIRICASTEKKELYSGSVTLRKDVTGLLEKRREARRTRRNRLRYRHARFNNRVRTKKKGWLAPSIRQKIDSQVTTVKKVADILPVENVNIEVARFDIQKIMNPEIQGEEYQQGLDEWNVREYVMARDKYTCRCCKGKSKDPILGVHHLKNLLPDRKLHYNQANTITVCQTCHKGIHEGTIELKIRKGGNFKAEAFMNISRWRLVEKLQNEYPNKVNVTYGYITKNLRIQNELPSTKDNHLLCLSGNPKAEPTEFIYKGRKLRCHNRKIYKENPLKGGIYVRKQSPKYINGIKLWDKVEYKGQVGFIAARNRQGCGYVRIKTFDGETIKSAARMDEVKVLEHPSSFVIDKQRKEK